MTFPDSHQARMSIVMDDYKEHATRSINEQLSHERAFALSAQVHASELEIELMNARDEIKRLKRTLSLACAYIVADYKLSESAERFVNQMKEML